MCACIYDVPNAIMRFQMTGKSTRQENDPLMRTVINTYVPTIEWYPTQIVNFLKRLVQELGQIKSSF